MANRIIIAVSKDIEIVKGFLALGFCPVECSFGGVSVCDELELDHHGSKSHLESVAIRAYRDFFGVRAEDQRFVVNHIDADSIFAVAALAGLLPHPELAKTMPAYMQKTWGQDLMPLAETISVMDTDPIGRDIISMPMGNVLAAWNALFGANANDELAAYAAVEGFRRLLTQPSARVFVSAAENAENERREAALADLRERGEKVGAVMTIKQSRVFGFDVWYQRNVEAGAPNEVTGWDNPIVISWLEGTENITMATPNKAVAEELLGEGGLMNVFKALNEAYGLAEGSGFGGRETIGGSPRGQKMTEADLAKAVSVLNQLMKK